MKRQFCRSLLVSLAVLLGVAQAVTAATPQGFQCPACGNSLQALLSQAPSASAGQDRDLMPRSLGEPPLLYEAVTCPKCFYSGYEADFEPERKLTAEAKTAIVEAHALKLPAQLGRDVPAEKLPAWARYDLAAQTMALTGRPLVDQAFALLAASWSVREAWYLPMAVSEERLVEFEQWESKHVDRQKIERAENPALEALNLAESLAKQTAAAPVQERSFPGLLAIFLFRSHGENPRAFAALNVLTGALEAKAYKELGARSKTRLSWSASTSAPPCRRSSRSSTQSTIRSRRRR
jgi:hypothetical protein